MNKFVIIFLLSLIFSSCATATNLFSIIDQDIYIEPYISKDNIESREKIDGNTPLIYACEKGDVESVRVLLDKGANLNAKNDYSMTCLMRAIATRRTSVTEVVLDYKPDVTITTKRGNSAIKYALHHHDLELIKKLVKLGGDPNISNVNFDPLILAAHKGDYDFAKELIEIHKLDVNEHYYPFSYSPLLQAVEYGHKDIVALLLKHGANMYHRDKVHEMTALELARYKRHKEIQQVLLDAGAKY